MTVSQDTNGRAPAHADHPYVVTLWWRPNHHGRHKHCTWALMDEPCTPYTFECIGSNGGGMWVLHLAMVDKPLPEQGPKHQAYMAAQLRSEIEKASGRRVHTFPTSLIMEPGGVPG